MKKQFLFLLILFGVLLVSSKGYPQLKKRVAVFTFEDKTDQSYYWWDGRSPGDGMADMLTTDLVKSGKYVVIERSEIARVIEEQQLGQAGLVTAQSAAQMGQLLGVELAIMGAVTEFGFSRGGTGTRIGGLRVGVNNQSATVAVDVRFVNTTTGEIIAADNVRKEESSGGFGVSTPEFGFNNRNDFDNSIVGKATRAAIDEIIDLVEQQMQVLPWEGKIILVRDNTIYIKPGSDAGVQVGDEFVVYAKGEELIDPDTGISLGSVETRVGMIEVTGIVSGGQAAIASIKTGSGFKVGDFVRFQ
ncbi:hypothetical protein JW824_03945 [bacterium]|nr:hypothetical protein [bacterium]